MRRSTALSAICYWTRSSNGRLSAAWAWALLAFHDQALLLGAALLAYGFGLRHAVDADHIAAIDNVTRKLMQEGKRPLCVGLFFALGHSTVVALAVAGVAATATLIATHFEQFRHVGGVIGTLVSAFFPSATTRTEARRGWPS